LELYLGEPKGRKNTPISSSSAFLNNVIYKIETIMCEGELFEVGGLTKVNDVEL